MTEEKDLRAIAEELGLSVEALTGTDVSLADTPKEKKRAIKGGGKRKEKAAGEGKVEKTAKTSKEPKQQVNKNDQAMEIQGIPANYQGRPIAYIDGQPREMVVPWDGGKQEGFRGNGRMVIKVYKAPEKKKGGDLLEVYTEKGGQRELLVKLYNHNKALKRAKTWATLLDLAFDPSKDIEVILQGVM